MSLRTFFLKMRKRPPLPVDDEQVLVRFTADWCQPCKHFAPVFDAVVAATGITPLVVNVDENAELVEAFGVLSIPAVFYINRDNIAYLQARTVPELLAEIKEY